MLTFHNSKDKKKTSFNGIRYNEAKCLSLRENDGEHRIRTQTN